MYTKTKFRDWQNRIQMEYRMYVSLQLESSAVAFRFGDHVITAKQQG
jgi:hypothetical protein